MAKALALLCLAAIAGCASTPEPVDMRYSSANRSVSDARAMRAAPPPMDPTRKVAQQDCSKPIDPVHGNLRCG